MHKIKYLLYLIYINNIQVVIEIENSGLSELEKVMVILSSHHTITSISIISLTSNQPRLENSISKDFAGGSNEIN